MAVKNRFADWLPEITEWRRDIHAHPELMFDTHRTAALVADKLRAFGCDEVHEGIGRTGVVGADMLAAANERRFEEATGLAYASGSPG